MNPQEVAVRRLCWRELRDIDWWVDDYGHERPYARRIRCCTAVELAMKQSGPLAASRSNWRSHLRAARKPSPGRPRFRSPPRRASRHSERVYGSSRRAVSLRAPSRCIANECDDDSTSS